MLLTSALIFFATVFAARMIPFIWSRSYGVDNWYWKLYFEEYRKTKKIPVKLPYYLLEYEEQWYPPLFPWLIGKLPQKTEEKIGWILSPAIDGLTGSMIGVYALFSFGLPASLAAVLMYALSPILEDYNVQLNPRVLGNFLYTSMVLLLLRFHSSSWSALFAAALLLALIALLHKMTMQISLFTLLCLAPLAGWRVFLIVPLAGFASAFLLSKGFYWKVLQAHWDIVTFWNRNWRWLNAHQYYDSPLYAHLRPEGYAERRLHRSGISGLYHHIKLLAGMLPSALVLIPGAAFSSAHDHPSFFWLCVVILFAGLTTLVPFLKCLGAGYYYQFNAAAPAAILTGLFASRGDFFSSFISTAAVALSSCVFVWIVFRLRKKALSGQGAMDEDLREILLHLKNLPKGNVWCAPFTLCDAAAYISRQAMAWGGHGMGFEALESFFPILRISFGEAVQRLKISYILLDKRYINNHYNALPDQNMKKQFEKGAYSLYLVNLDDIPNR